jgi:hypothetical protein
LIYGNIFGIEGIVEATERSGTMVSQDEVTKIEVGETQVSHSKDGENKGNTTIEVQRKEDGQQGSNERDEREDVSLHSGDIANAMEELESQKRVWYAYFLTRDFYIVLVLG